MSHVEQLLDSMILPEKPVNNARTLLQIIIAEAKVRCAGGVGDSAIIENCDILANCIIADSIQSQTIDDWLELFRRAAQLLWCGGDPSCMQWDDLITSLRYSLIKQDNTEMADTTSVSFNNTVQFHTYNEDDCCDKCGDKCGDKCDNKCSCNVYNYDTEEYVDVAEGYSGDTEVYNGDMVYNGSDIADNGSDIADNGSDIVDTDIVDTNIADTGISNKYDADLHAIEQALANANISGNSGNIINNNVTNLFDMC